MRTKTLCRAITVIISVLPVCCFSGCRPGKVAINESRQRIQQYNVTWDSPGPDYTGSMPAGNGDIGMNVWTEKNGDICFYIGKTDSWGENGRLLKIGKVRVRCEPAIVFEGSEFSQELDLLTATVRIRSTGMIENKKVDINLKVWADANNPVIHLSHESSIPLKMKASLELWRTRPFELKEAVFSDLMQSHADGSKMRDTVVVEPDIIVKNSEDNIVWYHHNTKSNGYDYVNELQGISEFCKSDPLLHRTFGALMKGDVATRVNDVTLETGSEKSATISVFVLTEHPSQPDEWQNEIERIVDNVEATPYKERLDAHEMWWGEFWDRSWINAYTDSAVSSPEEDEAYIVSRAYALQRFIDACAGRGGHPIKFNGSIFTVPPGPEISIGDPDYRQWGPGYWWQNTRLPYLSMYAAGDFDLLQPFFKMYGEEIFEISKQRTKKNFGFEGAYFPECMYFWGAQFPIDYGPKPWKERDDKLQDSRYHKWEWVCGPELVFMMLDYYDYTQDVGFLQGKVLPVANEVMKFFENYYQTDENGLLVMYPSQAVETWWDCTGPMPEIAGLVSITRRLLALPEEVISRQDRQFWESFNSKLPGIPVRETPSGKALAPAHRFEMKRNVENPELYAVFPFRLYGVGNPEIELAINALEHRWDEGDFGWRQDDIFMTYMGLTEKARENLVGRASKFDEGSRFPAFWGPNYDWVPDQDHGGVLMKAFQTMLIQADPYSKKIYLLPAWPDGWNVEFKLLAPYNTSIQGSVLNGKLEFLNVIPSSRKEDVVIMNYPANQ